MNRIGSLLGAGLVLAASHATAFAQDTGKVVLGWTPDLQTAPVVVANEKGYFKDEGLEVKSFNFVSGRAALEALLGGQLELAFMAEYPPVIAAMRHQKFDIVTTLSKYYGNRIISSSKVGFKSVKDLAGKQIGTTLGSNAAFFTELLLEKAKIKATVVNVAPPDIVPALSRGDIDAGVMFPDFYPKAAAVLGDKYREQIDKDYIANFVISASPSMMKRKGDLKKFLLALIKGEKFIQEHPAEAQDLVYKAMKGTYSHETIKAEWRYYKFVIGLDPQLLDLMTQEGKWIIGNGLIKNVKPTKTLFKSYFATAPMAAIDPKRVTVAK
jgi:NitT/TauT family transport system substrate-binding protein